MIRTRIFLVCLLIVICPTSSMAGVVLTSTVGANSNAQGKVIGSTSSTTNGAGVVFTTGSGSSWDLSSIKLAMTTGNAGSGSYGGGTVTFYLYQMASGSNATTNGSLNNDIGSTTASLASFSGNGASIILSLTGFDNLAASTQYFLGINVSGSVTGASSDNYLKITGTVSGPTEANGRGWSVAPNYSFLLVDPATTGNNNFSASTSKVAYSYLTSSVAGIGFELDASAVPEPGTLLLFSLAMAVGGAGAVLKRGKRSRKGFKGVLGLS